MKKILFLSLLFLTFSNGAYVYQNKCIDNYYFDNGLFLYHVVGSNQYDTTTDFIYSSQILAGYKINGTSCILDTNATALNISLPAYNFLMALSGILAGFAFFITVILAIKRGK